MENVGFKIVKVKTDYPKQILAYLKKGHALTKLESLNMFGCWNTGDVIFKLRNRGHNIITTMIKNKNGKKFASYKLRTITEKDIQAHKNCHSIKFNHDKDTLALNHEYYAECKNLTCKELYELLEKDYEIYPF